MGSMEEYMMDNLDALLPLRDVVFKTLRRAILTGELKPGERLMEIHLADKLGVSRTPIREAIRKLELEGLVVMVPRRGAQVAHITSKGMSEVLEVRLALEELAVGLACDRITDEEIDRLLVACTAFEKAVETGDISKITNADVAFHDIIEEASHNARLSQIISNLAEQMYRYRVEYIKDNTGWTTLISEHRMITDAIVKRDPSLATQAMHVHIKNQENTILRLLKKDKN